MVTEWMNKGIARPHGVGWERRGKVWERMKSEIAGAKIRTYEYSGSKVANPSDGAVHNSGIVRGWDEAGIDQGTS